MISQVSDALADCVVTCRCGQAFRLPPKGGRNPGPAQWVRIQEIPAGRGGCLPVVLEITCTFLSAGVIGGVGRIAAGKGPSSLILSLVVAAILGLITVLSLGVLSVVTLPIWGVFVFFKFFWDLITSAI